MIGLGELLILGFRLILAKFFSGYARKVIGNIFFHTKINKIFLIDVSTSSESFSNRDLNLLKFSRETAEKYSKIGFEQKNTKIFAA